MLYVSVSLSYKDNVDGEYDDVDAAMLLMLMLSLADEREPEES